MPAPSAQHLLFYSNFPSLSKNQTRVLLASDFQKRGARPCPGGHLSSIFL
ncbi:hypothetical protein GCWU000342_00763 [Shuttleworthella satelles DSM 14600]|uniref:Uncharacterized protein n=1 Tax=Shuttleworthella satelles DSM 14600 TaxID=626523 RepID=C4G9V9_9FIRM|nr:hypothetical protein GCWU000342_00763 [Shuttleworthia satelles DSM 14600]